MASLFFDLDGTILNTLGDLHTAVNLTMAEYGMASLTREQVRRYIGNGTKKLLLRAMGKEEGELPEAMLACYKIQYARHFLEKTEPYPYIPETLRLLRNKGHRLYVVSNKPETLTKALISHFFAEYIPEENVVGDLPPYPVKPAVDNLLRAAGGALPPESIMIGDGETDIQTARNASIPVLSVTWGYRNSELLEQLQPDRLLSSPCEIPAAVEDILQKEDSSRV